MNFLSFNIYNGKIVYKSEDDFNDFKKNYAAEVENKYFSDLVELAKKGDLPQDLYKPVKGSAYQQLERELSKKYGVPEYRDVFDLVDKLKQKPPASGNEDLLNQIKQLQDINETLQKEKDNAVTEVEKKYKQRMIDEKKTAYLSQVPFDFTDVKEDELDNRREKTQNILLSVFNSMYNLDMDESGSFIVRDKEGKVIQNTATLKPIPATDVFLNLAKDYNIKLKSPDTGGQGGRSSGKQTQGLYATVEEFEEAMQKAGIKTSDPKYIEEYRKSGLGVKR